MLISSRTPEGFPVECGICGAVSSVQRSSPPDDTICPACGTSLWVYALAEFTRDVSIDADALVPELQATKRDDAIAELIDALGTQHAWRPDVARWLLTAAIKREDLGSTCLGNGFAVPHASSTNLVDGAVAMGYSPRGLDFRAPDGKRVHTVVFVASLHSELGSHLRTLEGIARAIRFAA